MVLGLSKYGYPLVTILSLLFVGVGELQATHNRAGEITYQQIGELTIRIRIITYTKTSSPADRDTLTVSWGDGTFSGARRINGEGTPLPNDIKFNIYEAEHTYPGRATYEISFTDPNRIGNIKNVDFPNSINVPFHLKTTFTFLNPQFQGVNNSAILLQPPIDFACMNQRFVHNPNAYDPDGDSLAYELIVPFRNDTSLVPNYRLPDQVDPGPNNMIELNPVTGEFIWDAPPSPGEYNIAILIKEYRNGFLLNTIIRDMQILVRGCSNRPPSIDVPEEICVVAGEEISFDVVADDPDIPDQLVQMAALGGPFESRFSNAVFDVPTRYQEPPIVGRFSWTPSCNDITDQYYSVVFRAIDNIFDSTGLAELKTVRIRVIGPPPEDLEVTASSDGNLLTWSSPYACEQTEEDYFKGFTIWKQSQSNPFQIDTCNSDLFAQGYQPIAFNIKDYQFLDENIAPGDLCCYRVTATFALTSAAGNPFNIVESLPSNEFCSEIPLDAAYFTKVSIVETDLNNGSIDIRWQLPDPMDYDTSFYVPPYRLELFRATAPNLNVFEPNPIYTSDRETFNELQQDTIFVDQDLNTSTQHNYNLILRSSANENEKEVTPASSVFLSIQPSDDALVLSWEAQVPWKNYLSRIYRQNGNDFILIGQTNTNSFIDEDVVNGNEYCYYVETEGTYGIVGLPTPLINLSQEVCGIPEDVVAPCVPILTVSNSCDNNSGSASAFINFLEWDLPPQFCDIDDIERMNIYLTNENGEDTMFLESVEPTLDRFIHNAIDSENRCYVVTTLDSLGNESQPSNISCANTCPFYSLPNTFTPNGDGFNDLFIPFPYRSVDEIDLIVYNRWGQKVFESVDPDINWNGTNSTGSDLPEGVYFYVCKVFERTSEEAILIGTLTGNIELLR